MTTARRKQSKGPNVGIRGILIAAIPVLALTAGIPLANRVEPFILGLPFFIAYQTFWVLLTPGFLYLVDKTRT
jgi:uncharacterized protein DUF3311